MLEEKSYGYFDKRHSRIIEHLAESRNPRWNDEIKYGLRHLIPLLYWRSPASDDHFKSKIAEAKTIHEFGLEAIDTKNQKVVDDPNQHKEFLADPNFQKSIRMTYAHSMVHNPDSFDINPSHEWRLIYHEEDCIANVTSDNPIVFYRNPDLGGNIMGSQLIPISPTRTLLRLNENYKGNYHNQFIQNLAVVDQAIRYVICSDKEYLTRLIQAYEKIKLSDVLNDLKFDVFGLYE